MGRDQGLDSLLALDGEIIMQEGGWWVKIEAKEVAISKHIPHGVSYCLTLHDHLGQRIMGYDNAHAVKLRRPSGSRYQGRRTKAEYDHRHQRIDDKGVPYQFKDAGQLLTDFWAEVDTVLQAHGII